MQETLAGSSGVVDEKRGRFVCVLNELTELPFTLEMVTVKDGYRFIKPYWYNYRTHAKGRWVGRRLVDVLKAEFGCTHETYFVSDLHCHFKYVLMGLIGFNSYV